MNLDYEVSLLGLTDKAAKACRFHLQLSNSFVRDTRITAEALQGNGYPARKFALSSFRSYCLMASGAQWVCDANGDWQLVETNGLEPEAVVIELLEYLGIPLWVFTGKSLHQVINPAQLATLFQLGCSLNMESFKHPAQTKDGYRQTYAGGSGKEERSKAEYKNSSASGNCANVICCLFNTVKYNLCKIGRRIV
jgi:hypothetical protein